MGRKCRNDRMDRICKIWNWDWPDLELDLARNGLEGLTRLGESEGLTVLAVFFVGKCIFNG